MQQRWNRINIFFLIGFTILLSACKQNGNPAADSAANPTMVISDELPWSERMALSIMKRNPKAYMIDGRSEAKWDYVHGLVLQAFQQLPDPHVKFNPYVTEYADTLIQSLGLIDTYKKSDYNIDMINAGKILFDIYSKTQDEKYKMAMDTLRSQIANQPRTESGGFWHKKRYPNQMWLDGLYMGAPFYARYNVTYENGDKIDDIIHQFDLIQEHARDEETGLLYHAWDESKEMAWANKETGNAPNFWLRSLGWYAMALVDVLDYVPVDHPKRPNMINYLNQLAEAVSAIQDESGLWYQVPNFPDREGNYLEASGSCMLSYALAKGTKSAYLAEKYHSVAQKAFDGITRDLIKVDADGEVTITQVCAVAGLGGDPYRDGSYEYYINERKQDNDPKATGPFILAALELNQ